MSVLHDRNATDSARHGNSEEPLTSVQCLAIAVPAVLVGLWSSYSVYDVLSVGDPVRMTAGDIESGTAAPGLWNEVSGVLLLDKVHVHRSRRSTTYYVPLVSPTWRPDNEVAVVVRFTEFPQEAGGVFQGITPRHHGIPSSAVEGLAEAGVPLAENCLLLKADETPASRAAMNSVGVLVALFGIGFAAYKWPASAPDGAAGQQTGLRS